MFRDGLRQYRRSSSSPPQVLHESGHVPLCPPHRLVKGLRQFLEQGLILRRRRRGLRDDVGHGDGVPVRKSEGAQGVDQMPGRAIHNGLAAGVDPSAAGAPSPALPGADQFQVDDALVAQAQPHPAAGVLGGVGVEDGVGPGQTVPVAGDDLGEVGAADLLLPLGDEHQVDGEGSGHGQDRFQGVEPEAVGAPGVVGAPGDDDQGEGGLGDQIGGEGVVGPGLTGHGLDVVHAIVDQGFRCTDVQDSPNTGVTVGLHEFHFLAAQVPVVVHQELGTFADADVLGADAGLAEVLPQFFYVLVPVEPDVVVDGLPKGHRASF